MQVFFLFLFTITSIYSVAQKDYRFSHGTVIVEYWTKDTVWIAADTKEVMDNNKNSSVRYVHKIVKYGNAYYTMAGKTSFGNKDKKGLFDAGNDLERILNRKETMQKTIQLYSDTVLRHLGELLKAFVTYKLMTVEELQKYPVLETTITKFSDGKLLISYIEFAVIGNSTKWSLTATNYDLAGQTNCIVMGYRDEIDDFLYKNPNYFKGGHIKEKLNQLICMAIKTYPDHVGLPIDFLKITKNGSKPLTQSNACK